MPISLSDLNDVTDEIAINAELAQLARVIADLHCHVATVEAALSAKENEYEELQQFTEAACVERDQNAAMVENAKTLLKAADEQIRTLAEANARLVNTIENQRRHNEQLEANTNGLQKQLRKAKRKA